MRMTAVTVIALVLCLTPSVARAEGDMGLGLAGVSSLATAATAATPAADSASSLARPVLALSLLADGNAVDGETTDGDAPAESSDAAAEWTKGPPLPFLSIEGVSGAVITPMAYFCNPGKPGATVSGPNVAYTFLNLGSRELHTIGVTMVFFNRIELGYGVNFLNVGSLQDDIVSAVGVKIRDHVTLHHINARVLLVEENSFDMPLPAITAGVHFKYNDGISRINDQLGGALGGIGYDQSHGIDYTLTATKMFPELAFGRPVILTAGLRNSNASQIGLLGFGENRTWTVEGSVVTLPLDNVALAYEFRQKGNPYDKLGDLIDREQNWHAFSASWVVSDRLTLTAVYGLLGNVANARADDTMAIQIKFEF
jgi:Protein of unknown function (DUF3034)